MRIVLFDNRFKFSIFSTSVLISNGPVDTQLQLLHLNSIDVFDIVAIISAPYSTSHYGIWDIQLVF